MRRKPKTVSLAPPIKAYFPLVFWVKCDRCLYEFRREKGYRAELEWGQLSAYSYLCGSCAPSLAEAKALFSRRPWLSRAAKPPTGR